MSQASDGGKRSKEAAKTQEPAGATAANPGETESVDRRAIRDRRKRQIPIAVDRRQGDERRGERRRQVDPTTCERDYNVEEIEFMRAMDEYKRDFGRPFPTWSEVLEVLKSLGYRRVAERSVILPNRAKANLANDTF